MKYAGCQIINQTIVSLKRKTEITLQTIYIYFNAKNHIFTVSVIIVISGRHNVHSEMRKNWTPF